jgi:PPOX class probable F420-dependent enzyme
MRGTIRSFCEENGVTLNDAKYFSLATFRKNGKEVATPVWFAAAGSAFYVFSAGNAGKVKRIRGGSRARIAPCDGRGKVLGDWQDAVARLVSDPAEAGVAYGALRKKYGLLMAVTDFIAKLNGRYERRQLIAVSLSAAK